MLLLLGYTHSVFAQEAEMQGPFPNFFNTFNCFPSGVPVAQRVVPGGGTTASSEYGYALTPRGELRVLVIYAGFTNDNISLSSDPSASNIPYNNTDPDNSWPQTLNGSAWGESLPRTAASTFYTSPTQFSATATDLTLSNFYYQMSQHGTNPFKMLAVNFPVRVNVTATTPINSTGSAWDTYNRMVLDKIRTDATLQAHMVGLNRAQLDARTNTPNFQVDNSSSSPDNWIDYTVIIWRYAGGSGNNPGKNGPLNGRTANLENALGSGGGYASVPIITLIPANGTTPQLRTADGFSQFVGISGIHHDLFTHEFAHTLYCASHVNGNNGVCGKKFYVTPGNSMTTGNINAWERWFLGWAPLQCNGVNSDLTATFSLTANRRYILRDFITTGDMIRIRIPNTYNAATGTFQHLWLENRQKKSVWDQRQWTTNGAGQPFPVVRPGLTAFIEDMGQLKTNPRGWAGFNLGANGLKFLSDAGQYDFAWQGTSSTYNNALWGNPIFNFSADVANPLGGQSTFAYLRGDKDNDNVIGHNDETNSGAGNEYFHFSAVSNTPTYGFMGHDARFNPLRKIGLDSNPGLSSYPDFDATQQQMAPMQLSGVSVLLVDHLSDGSIIVEVSFADTDITQSTRWAGNLNVSNVAGAANDYDVNVLPGVRLRVDRSGTPNRTTPGPHNDFINDTYMTVAAGALVHLDADGILQIGGGSTVFVQDGGQLVPEEGAMVEVEGGGLLSVQTQAQADYLLDNKLKLYTGGRLEVRDSGTIISGRSAPRLAVYPNPATEQQLSFMLENVRAVEASTYTYRVVSAYGKTVRQGRCAQAQVSVSGVPTGTYLLELTGPEGQRITRRVQVTQ